MPQLVKGGKYAYAWSKVQKNGRIKIPIEALKEYNFKSDTIVILIPGSKRSGGFSISTEERLRKSPTRSLLDEIISLRDNQSLAGKEIDRDGKTFCFVKLKYDGSINIPVEILKKYGINVGDCLLSVRGSNLALGFIVRGPIIEEAKKHSELEMFE
ncbi:MAG: hypothetical protein ACFFDT_30555 [Candidatus Hodarchaeota archaeon]